MSPRQSLAMCNSVRLVSSESRPSPLLCEGIVRLTGEDAIKLGTLHTALMRTSVSLYHRHRFPAEIISHSVWLYFRFALSLRDIEEMLACAASSSLTKPSANGASSSGRLMPTTCDEDLRGLAGILMKCSSRSMDAFITYGVQLIRMAR